MKADIPKVKVQLFVDIREVFQAKEIEIELESARNVGDLLDLLCNTHERRQRIFDQSGQVRSDVTIFKEGRDIYFLDGVQTELKEGDTIAIFPLICGG